MIKFAREDNGGPFQRSEAFMKGYNTLQPKHFNPYSKNTLEREEWDHGWLTRFYGETI